MTDQTPAITVNGNPVEPGCKTASHQGFKWSGEVMMNLADSLLETGYKWTEQWPADDDDDYDLDVCTSVLDECENALNDVTSGGYWHWEDGELWLTAYPLLCMPCGRELGPQDDELCLSCELEDRNMRMDAATKANDIDKMGDLMEEEEQARSEGRGTPPGYVLPTGEPGSDGVSYYSGDEGEMVTTVRTNGVEWTLTEKQARALANLCARYKVPFSATHYVPMLGFSNGWVEGWVGGPEHGQQRLADGTWLRGPKQTIFIGCSPEGDTHS